MKIVPYTVLSKESYRTRANRITCGTRALSNQISFEGNLEELQRLDILDKRFKRGCNMYRANNCGFNERLNLYIG